MKYNRNLSNNYHVCSSQAKVPKIDKIEINESLTFKTLSLGFFITAMDQWKTSFKHIGM